MSTTITRHNFFNEAWALGIKHLTIQEKEEWEGAVHSATVYHITGVFRRKLFNLSMRFTPLMVIQNKTSDIIPQTVFDELVKFVEANKGAAHAEIQ
jgi:hypothetical protein